MNLKNLYELWIIISAWKHLHTICTFSVTECKCKLWALFTVTYDLLVGHLTSHWYSLTSCHYSSCLFLSVFWCQIFSLFWGCWLAHKQTWIHHSFTFCTLLLNQHIQAHSSNLCCILRIMKHKFCINPSPTIQFSEYDDHHLSILFIFSDRFALIVHRGLRLFSW